MDEIIDAVDKTGRVVGRISRVEAHLKGIPHKAVNIVVFNSKGEIYIQRRSKNKSVFPLFWDISASETLKSGESYKEAAKRGLAEELSIRCDVELIRPVHVQRCEYRKGKELIKEYEFVELYKALWDGEIELDPEEVADGKLVSVKELKKFGERTFTPWGLDEIRFILENPKVTGGLIR